VGFGWELLTFLKPPVCFTEVVKGAVPKTFHQRSQEKIMSIRMTAKSIGNKDASTAELAAIIRKAYAKAKPEQQPEIRADFYIGYIAGRDRVSISEAAAIVAAGKGAEAINAPAIVRATAAWKYHVVDNGGTKAPAAPAAQQRISKEHREAAMDFLGNFKGETLAEQIAQAIKVLNAMK